MGQRRDERPWRRTDPRPWVGGIPVPRAGYLVGMDFVRTREGELAAPPGDVAQEAVDATTTTYANDPGIDVAEHLRAQFSSRGLQAAREEDLSQLAQRIRSGHAVRLGHHDGSVDPNQHPGR